MPHQNRNNTWKSDAQKRLVDYFLVYTCKPRRREGTTTLNYDHENHQQEDIKQSEEWKSQDEDENELKNTIGTPRRHRLSSSMNSKAERRTVTRSVHLNLVSNGGITMNSDVIDQQSNYLDDSLLSSNNDHYSKLTKSLRGLRVPVTDETDVNESNVSSDCNSVSSSVKDSPRNCDDLNDCNLTPSRVRVDYSDDEDETEIEQDSILHSPVEQKAENIVPPSFASTDEDFFDNKGSLLSNEFTLVPVQTSRYPKIDHPDNPLNPMISHFCFPVTVQMSAEYKIPRVHYFVLTNDKGKKMYGTCLTVWEEFIPVEDGNLVEQELSHLLKKKGVIHDEGVYGTDVEVSLTSDTVVIYVPKVLCILSSHAYLQSFREYLAQLYRLATMTDMMKVPIERYIINICDETPAPPPGIFEIQLEILNSKIPFWSPPANQPVAYVALPFNVLFECLDLNNVIFVWYALTLERKVLLVSSQFSLLTICAEILCSLLFPMEWNHLYIPILPRFLTPMLEAPMPYLCGIIRQHFAHAIEHISDETIVVDLDQNLITMGELTPPFPPIPFKRRAKLEAALDENAGDVFWAARGLTKSDIMSNGSIILTNDIMENADLVWKEKLNACDNAFNLGFTPDSETLLNGDKRNEALDENFSIKYKQSRWDKVQESFLRFYVSMLRDYNKYIGSDEIFRTKDFIASQRSDYKYFLKEFCCSQQFDFFISKKILNPQEPTILFFDQSINAKKNRSRLSLKKKETSFLTGAQAHKQLRTVHALEPAGKEIDGANLLDKLYGSQRDDKNHFSYRFWPEKFDEHFLGSARPIPVAIAAEFERINTLTRTLSTKYSKIDEDNFHPGASIASIETGTFTLFFVLFCKGVVGKEFELMRNGFLEGRSHLDVKDRQRLIAEKLKRVVAEEIDDNDSKSYLIPDCAQLCSPCIDHLKKATITTETLATLRPLYAEDIPAPLTGNTSRRTRDKVSEADVEMSQLVAAGHLELAFSALDMVLLRKIPIDQDSFRALMEACGRCGNTDRATQLMALMKAKHLAVDSEMYSSYLTAFSVANDINPDDPIASPLLNVPITPSFSAIRKNSTEEILVEDKHPKKWFRKRAKGTVYTTDTSGDDSNSMISSEVKSESSRSKPPGQNLIGIKGKKKRTHLLRSNDLLVTEPIQKHIDIGDSLLDYLYDGVTIDCKGDTCPQCSIFMNLENLMLGWNFCSFTDYTTVCMHCKHRFIPRFVVDTNSTSFLGSRGLGTPLYCEFLSPWVLHREISLATDCFENFDIILAPEWRSGNGFCAKLWWNLVVLFKQQRLPFSFLLQGSFKNRLIMPMDTPKS